MAGVEEDQQKILLGLFKTMSSWSREKMRDWINEVMGEDESMKPVIDQLYERKDITNDELIDFFKGMLMGGEEQEQVEPQKTKSKPEPKTSKKEKKKPPPSSSSSSASERHTTKKGKKRKLVVSESESSSDSGAESDATVDLAASKKHKISKGKKETTIPPIKIKKEKHEVKEVKKKKMSKFDSDEDDSGDFQITKHKHSQKIKVEKDLDRHKSDKQKDTRKNEVKIKIEKPDKPSKKDDRPGKSTEKERHSHKDKSDKDRDKAGRVEPIKIKVEKDDSRKDKQSYVKESLEKERRDKSDIRDNSKKLESKPDRDKVDKTHRDKPAGERVKGDKDYLENEKTVKDKSSKDKEKPKSTKDETDKHFREKERSDKPDVPKEKSEEVHIVDRTDKVHKTDRDKVGRVDKIEKPHKQDKYIDLTQDHFDPKEFKVSKPDRPRAEKDVTDGNKSIRRPSADVLAGHLLPEDKFLEKPHEQEKIKDGDINKTKTDKPDDLVRIEKVPLQTQFPMPKEDLQTQFPRPKEDLQTQFPRPKEDLQTQFPRPKEDLQAQFPRPKEDLQTQFPRPNEDLQAQFPRPKEDECKETSHLGPIVRPRNAPIYLDPQYNNYRKKFKLRPITVELYDIRRQSLHWRSGDKVYRAQLADERRKRKEQKRIDEKKEKYSERGTRILPFEKRPENAELYRKKGEITREKPKVQTQTEKERLLMELHKKDRDKEKEKKIKTINSEFKIPKKGEKKRYVQPIIQDNIVSSHTPLAPAAQLKMSFDKNRLVVQQRETSWQMTPEEERAMKGEKVIPKPKQAQVKAVKEKVVDLTFDDELGDFGIQDDDYQADDHEPEEAPDGSYCYPNTPPPPVSEVEVNDISRGVLGLLDAETVIQPPQENCSHGDVIIRKIAKWFRYSEAEPYYQTCPSLPEQSEENFYTLMMSTITDDDDVSFVGNVSNPDGEDYDLQDNEITSTARDPDLIDEYCGAGLLYSQIRVKPGEGKDCYKNIFDVRRGCNYDKHNFQAKCNLCEELITDKRHLGAHIRSTSHRANMASTSLKLIGLESKLGSSEKRPISPTDTVTSKSSDKSRSKAKDKESNVDSAVKTTEKEKNGKTGSVREKQDTKTKTDPAKVSRAKSGSSHTTIPSLMKTNVDSSRTKRKSRSRSPIHRHRRSRSRSRGRRSRSRSRSRKYRRSRSRSPRSSRHRHRHSRSRSRSAGRRRSSKDQIDEFLAMNERVAARRSSAPKPAAVAIVRGKKETGDIFREKLILQGTGKWTPQLEARWKLWEDEEDRLKKIFAQKRKMLEEKPEDHPKYAEEWPKFWEKRYQELSEKGMDAETYDYAPEWKVYWGKLSEAFLDREMAIEMQEIRVKYGMDLETLQALNAAAAPATAVPPVVPHAPPAIPPGSYDVPPPLPYIAGQPLPPGVAIPVNYPPPVTLPVQPPQMVPPVPRTPTYTGPVMPVYGVAPPVAVLPAIPLVTATITATPAVPQSSTVAAAVGADYTTKSMSISSGSNISPYSDRVANLIPSAPKVTIDDIRSTWENLTGQKIQQAVVEKAKSIASNTSSKSKDYDFDGLDVVEVLRLMTCLEDELSFLAIKVLEYYKMAEKMESEEPRKSFALLKDVEFVTLLHQCRNKFFTLLSANVSASDVMKKLNLTVFAMNALIDLPMCQKIRTSVPGGLPNPVTTVETVAKPRDTDSTFRNIPAPSSLVLDLVVPPKAPLASKVYSNPIEAALADVSMQQKIEMSTVIARSLIAQGKDRLTPPELMTTLLQIMSPILAGTASTRSSAGSTRRSTTGEPPLAIPGPPSGAGSGIGGSLFDRRFNDDFTRSTMRGSSSSRSQASELFPEILARAVSPPAEKRQPQEIIGNFGLSSFLPNPYRGGGGGRRDYKGNPIPLDQGNLSDDAFADRPFYRYCTNSNVSPSKSRDVAEVNDISTVHHGSNSIDPNSCQDPAIRLMGYSRPHRTTIPETRQQITYPGSSGRRVENVDVDDDGVFQDVNKQLPPGILHLIEKEKRKPSIETNHSSKVSQEESTKVGGRRAYAGSELSLVSGLSSSTNKSGRKRRKRKDGVNKGLEKNEKHRKTQEGSQCQSVSASKDRSKRLKRKKKHRSSSIVPDGKKESHRRSSTGSRTGHHSRRSSKISRTEEQQARTSTESRLKEKKSRKTKKPRFLTEYDRRHPPPSNSSSASIPCRVAPQRTSLSSISPTGSVLEETQSKRHHRSNKKRSRSHKKGSHTHMEHHISGVSKSFWDPPASDVSSEECFEESGTLQKEEVTENIAAGIGSRRDSAKSEKSYRRAGKSQINDPHDDTEDGEIVSSSDSFYDFDD